MSNGYVDYYTSKKCCYLRGLGQTGPTGTQGPSGDTGITGPNGPPGANGGEGPGGVGGYGSILLTGQTINMNTPFSIPINGPINTDSYCSVNISTLISGKTLIVNPNISFNYSEYVDLNFGDYPPIYQTYTYYPSTFSKNSINTVVNPMYLTNVQSGSTYSYSGALNDYFHYTPSYGNDSVINRNFNVYVYPSGDVGATYSVNVSVTNQPIS